jgi:polyhydroxybutyrate depolymerase
VKRRGLLVVAAVALAGCSPTLAAPPPAGTTPPPIAPAGEDAPRASPVLERHEVTVDGRTRTWLTYRPAGSRPRGLVVVLHGKGGDGNGMRALGFEPLADRDGVELAYPDGFDGSWNDGRVGVASVAHRENLDDVAFLRSVVEQAVREDHVPAGRVGVVGHSNGALMTGRLACTDDVPITAAVLVAGTGGAQLPAQCTRRRALSLLAVHGTADPVVPFEGGEVATDRNGSRGSAAPARTMMHVWRTLWNCAAPTTTDIDGPPASIEDRSFCPDGREVTLRAVTGGNHNWQPAPGFDTTGLAWRFLTGHGVTTGS